MRTTVGSSSRQAKWLVARSRLASVARRPAASRATAVVASSRLVLTPTGSGSCEHIGSKLPLPKPIPLKDGVYEVGRSSPADILLPIPTVSTRHALLRVEDATVYITDLNSTNGTLVNGVELSPMDNVAVEVGAEVVFGDVYLARFQLDLVADAASPPSFAAAAGSGSSGAEASGTVVLGAEDSGDAAGGALGMGLGPGLGLGGGAGGGGGGVTTRPVKRPKVRQDFSPY
ncbi:hypothetical protein Rsub_02598 [Raphidocelis subcapitata]|uniref:FHA domain-containing protein n=1 Tax=Raphidocelis subcapitata TaxID=307507 RepID=A0A2V0NQJ1_9CHLO|nr:hypothetical protein Rsub_02598 [Raphidocelis subcapitata]|eukprot:GBF89894.1 hypothetical protein Rsub_02598 [Raphidocelis subcapitata]